MTSYQTNSEAATDETTTINHVEIIENVIDTLEQDDSAMVNHNAEGGILWKFKYGSVEVFVQLGGTTDEDTLTVWVCGVKVTRER